MLRRNFISSVVVALIAAPALVMAWGANGNTSAASGCGICDCCNCCNTGACVCTDGGCTCDCCGAGCGSTSKTTEAASCCAG